MLDIGKVGIVKYGEKVNHLFYDGDERSYGIYQDDCIYTVDVHYKNQDRYNDRFVASDLGTAFQIIEAMENGEEV